jgi:glycosyltransferase involved in cell wall biosynthesis
VSQFGGGRRWLEFRIAFENAGLFHGQLTNAGLRCHKTVKWLCCQLGAREHYAIPRALFRQGSLDHLLTDAWAPPGGLLAALSFGLGERFHTDLTEASVRAWNAGLLALELTARLKRLSGWPLIVARNHWFQRKVVSFLADCEPRTDNREPTLFSYSYTALEPFRFAKSRGWGTVLGQIDPGPQEENIVAEEVAHESALAGGWVPAPASYWSDWREECALADRILVNSQWSRSCLLKVGINDSKLFVIPLAYQSPMTDTPIIRDYPRHFTPDRPLRVLFLGQISLRKGIARLLKVARSFQSEPIEFLMIGAIQIDIPEDLRSNPKIQWIGPVARNSVRKYYGQADVFILPTLSDGFGLSQLEALAHRLPVIASRQCGEVVIDHVNGLLLEEPTAAAIEEALRFCLDNPDRLAQFSENATVGERFSLSYFGTRLCALAM